MHSNDPRDLAPLGAEERKSLAQRASDAYRPAAIVFLVVGICILIAHAATSMTGVGTGILLICLGGPALKQ